MTTRRDYDEISTRKQLQAAGWDVQKQDSVKFNHGSETIDHLLCKLLTAYTLREQGYRVDTEVQMGSGEVDVLAYSGEDKFVVECETDPTTEVVSEKVGAYVRGEPVRECFVLPVDQMPLDMKAAQEWIAQELFGATV